MSGHRKALRDACRAALAVEQQIGGYTVLRTWSQNIDESVLPAWGVFTPRDAAGFVDKENLEHQVQVAVALRRVGLEDLEDTLDDDADRIIATVMPALDVAAFFVGAPTLEFTFGGEGTKRAGQVTVTFTCHVHAQIPTA